MCSLKKFAYFTSNSTNAQSPRCFSHISQKVCIFVEPPTRIGILAVTWEKLRGIPLLNWSTSTFKEYQDMQHRMRTHQLDAEQMERVLNECMTGSIATINRRSNESRQARLDGRGATDVDEVNDDSTPYVTPIHYAIVDGRVCFHGLPAGQKVSNIKANPHVCFNAYRMDCLLLDENGQPCDTNTKY